MPKLPKIIVLLDPARAYERSLLQGVWEYANLRGPWVFIREAPYYQQFSGLQSDHLDELAACQADGIITHFRRNIPRIAQLGLPMVVVPGMDVLPDAVNLINDDRAIGHLAADHLAEMGLRHFAYAGFDQLRWSLERLQGFRQRLTSQGFAVESHLVPYHTNRRQAARKATELARWLQALPKPLGLMASNDEFALSISDLCREHQLRVPDQVAIIGVDNDEVICELSSPPLSSIAIAARRAGYEAAELLDRLMCGQPVGQSVVARPSHVVRRQSTDLTAVDDAEVAKALAFIRANAHRVIQVTDVARATNLARRTLADRFAQCLGRTIADEINRRRMEQITRILLSTNRPVAQIADDLGYTSDKHFARYFRRQMGVTPRAYRKQFGPR